MKPLNILGLTFFSIGALAILGLIFYEIFKDSNIHPIIRFGIVAIVLGIIIILISLIKERLEEEKHDNR